MMKKGGGVPLHSCVDVRTPFDRMSQTTIPTQSADVAASNQAVQFLNQLFPEPRTFDIRLWDGTVLRAARTSPFTIVLNSLGALRRMFSLPIELSLGEAYIRGDFDVEGDVFA